MQASQLANTEVEQHIKKNIKKILKMRDFKDYKERVKKFLKQMFTMVQNKFNKNVRTMLTYNTHVEKAISLEWNHSNMHIVD